MRKPIILSVILTGLFFILPLNKNIAFANTAFATINTNFIASTSLLFNEMHLREAGMAPAVFNTAMQGFQKLNDKNVVKRNDIITIIDFSQPSNKKRLYVLDLENKEILFNTLVAHGKNSGKLWAKSFSNNPSSLKSSPGFYVTAETYLGDNGYSLRLDGMEKNINDNARERSIVMHGAPYVAESAIDAKGFLGRSWGCPAIPLASRDQVINTIKDGTCLFIYSPSKNYLQRSPILNS